jgi:hypothetical protein
LSRQVDWLVMLNGFEQKLEGKMASQLIALKA